MIPLYNHERYIGEAIDSVLAQGPVVREIVVIDDGSTDRSAAVVQDMARADTRISFRSRPNRGAHATINEGLSLCAGEFIAILNSDDCYLPDRLEILTELLDANPSAGLAASRLRFMDANSSPIDNEWYGRALQFFSETRDFATALINANFLMTTSNFVIRRSITDTIGGFAELRYTHDLDYALRLLARGYLIALTEHELLRYRIHQSNTIAEDHSKVRAEWALAAAAYLTCMLDDAAFGAIDWPKAAAIESVLLTHELSRAAHLAMVYLRRKGGSSLHANPLLDDAAFREQIAGWA